MHARVIAVEAAPERFDEDIATVTSRVMRSVQASPGFKGAYWFGDRSQGLALAVVFFNAEDTLHTSYDQGERIRHEVSSAVGARVMGVEEYEVVAETGPTVSHTAQFCRSLTWQEDPQRIEHAIRRINEGVMPGVRRNAGFQGGFWLVDRKTGRSVGFTLWDTAENFRTSGEIRQANERGAGTPRRDADPRPPGIRGDSPRRDPLVVRAVRLRPWPADAAGPFPPILVISVGEKTVMA